VQRTNTECEGGSKNGSGRPKDAYEILLRCDHSTTSVGPGWPANQFVSAGLVVLPLQFPGHGGGSLDLSGGGSLAGVATHRVGRAAASAAASAGMEGGCEKDRARAREEWGHHKSTGNGYTTHRPPAK
jgi:hypothetical protein